MLRASIDLGTNTCLLLIAEWDESAQTARRVVDDYATIVRLGQGVDQNRSLHPDAVQRTLACLRRYSQLVKDHGLKPESVICVATSQARDAGNSSAFFAQVTQEAGFSFSILSGDDEAKCTFLGGLLPGADPQSSVVIDIGGGSTELMSAQGGQSLDIGSVRFTERFLKSDPVTDSEFWKCQEAIDAALDLLRPWRSGIAAGCALTGVAGTVTTLASWHLGLTAYDADQLNQVVLTRGDVHRQVEELKWRKTAERANLAGIEKNRADVLLAGAQILWRSMEVLEFETVQVSARGLRFGALMLRI